VQPCPISNASVLERLLSSTCGKYRCSVVSAPIQWLSATCGLVFPEVVSSLTEACKSQQQLHGDGLHQEHCARCGQRIPSVVPLPRYRTHWSTKYNVTIRDSVLVYQLTRAASRFNKLTYLPVLQSSRDRRRRDRQSGSVFFVTSFTFTTVNAGIPQPIQDARYKPEILGCHYRSTFSWARGYLPSWKM